MKKLFVVIVFLLFVGVAGAQNSGSLPVDFILSNNTSPTYPPGTTMTLPIMTASSQTSSCTLGSTCTWTAGGEGTGNPGSISNFSVAANQNVCSNLGPITLNNSSTTFPTQSLNYNSIEFDATSSSQAGLGFSGSAGSIHALSGLLCATSPPYTGSGSDWDFWDYWAVTGYYSVVQFNDTSCGTPASLANYGVRIEHGHPTSHSPTCIHLVPETAYLFSHYYNFATGQTNLEVFTTEGTLIGTINYATSDPSSSLLTMSFGNGESNSSSTPYYYHWMMLNWTTAPNPMFWTVGTVQPPTGLAATVQ